MTAQQVKKADDEAAKKAPPPTPKTTEKTAQTGAGAKTDLKAAKPSRDGAKTTAVAKAKTPATKKAEKAPAKDKAPAKPSAPRTPNAGNSRPTYRYDKRAGGKRGVRTR